MNLIEKIEHSKTLIKEALDKYNNVRLACSFGKDSMVILHLALQINPNISVFAIFPPMKPGETFVYANEIRRDWNIRLEIITSDHRVINNLWKIDPDECCRIFKVEPTKRALEGVDCWITGLRNTEGKTRKDYQEIEDFGYIVKLNPILTWTEREIWQYLATHNVPVHPWYKKGHRSLGCEPCSAIIDETQDERDGRWQGTRKEAGECGIHTMNKNKKWPKPTTSDYAKVHLGGKKDQ